MNELDTISIHCKSKDLEVAKTFLFIFAINILRQSKIDVFILVGEPSIS